MKYKPTTKQELKVLVNDLSIDLGDIDTSLITDMRRLFENTTNLDDPTKEYLIFNFQEPYILSEN